MSMNWFVLRVQSGREESVMDGLRKRIQLAGAEDKVGRILVPKESVTEIKGGKRRVVEKKLYAGYVMVELETDDKGAISDDIWYLVRETPGIGDFVGSNNKPTPMTDEEVEKMLGLAEKKEEEEPQLKIDFSPGENVKILEGPFENFDGVVDDVNQQKGLVKVIVTIFGRATPVELEYWKVEST